MERQPACLAITAALNTSPQQTPLQLEAANLFWEAAVCECVCVFTLVSASMRQAKLFRDFNVEMRVFCVQCSWQMRGNEGVCARLE